MIDLYETVIYPHATKYLNDKGDCSASGFFSYRVPLFDLESGSITRTAKDVTS